MKEPKVGGLLAWLDPRVPQGMIAKMTGPNAGESLLA